MPPATRPATSPRRPLRGPLLLPVPHLMRERFVYDSRRSWVPASRPACLTIDLLLDQSKVEVGGGHLARADLWVLQVADGDVEGERLGGLALLLEVGARDANRLDRQQDGHRALGRARDLLAFAEALGHRARQLVGVCRVLAREIVLREHSRASARVRELEAHARGVADVLLETRRHQQVGAALVEQVL